MTEENKVPVDPKDLLKLKLTEPEILGESPWDDDVLNRGQIAERLTNLIETQSVPFVISVHGAWGTGKTFMLKRWQKDLERQNFQAIYFNAWEDDFCDDPLIAIIGQLSDYFKKGKFNDDTKKIIKSANSLIRRSSVSVSLGVVSVTTQLDNGQEARDLLQEYLDQRKTKDTLKEHLEDLSAKVVKDTGHPLVFIIDELDRCRPTFAIELLERVKHIFDVQNLVFVFGINRDELCSSLCSVYGEINADVYLRRFFDLDFTLPTVDKAIYCRHVLKKFELREFFEAYGGPKPPNISANEFSNFESNISLLWANLGLSLRDIDYCVRLLSSICKNLGIRQRLHPALLGLLIPLKFTEASLYARYVQGQCLGSEVMDHIDGMMATQLSDGELAWTVDAIEAHLYFVDQERDRNNSNASTALEQIKLLSQGFNLTHPELLSQRTRGADKNRARELMERMTDARRDIGHIPNIIEYLAELINLQQEFVRR